jgi:hypothetical protein
MIAVKVHIPFLTKTNHLSNLQLYAEKEGAADPTVARTRFSRRISHILDSPYSVALLGSINHCFLT